MLTIYGALNSRASRIAWVAEELGLDYDHVPVVQASRLADPAAPGAPVNTASAEFLAVNPAGLIPTVVDDGLMLTESLAINLYLVRKHGGPLAPRDLAEETLMLQWTLWAATEVEPFAIDIIVNRQIRDETDYSEAEMAAALKMLAPRMRVLDRALGDGGGHLVGGRFTVADINVAEVVGYAAGAPELFDGCDHLGRWLVACRARPAAAAVAARRAAEPLPDGWRDAYRRVLRPGRPAL